MNKLFALVLCVFSLAHSGLVLSDKGTLTFARRIHQDYSETNWLLAEDVAGP